ncbi:MAG TPA: glycosyltransferase family 87 protein [Polyangia bacterium]|jgi:hypothetical protein|nr:glycosyltransferase family 87 protein [Polyangia bacterium]
MTRQRRIVVGLVALAAASAGAVPLLNAIDGARGPIDFARDFTAARALAHGDRRYAIDAERHNREAAAAETPTVPLHGGPYLPHPPPATVALLPLAPLSFGAASALWLLLSLAALVSLARVLADLLWPQARAAVARTAALTGALLLWPPVLHNFEKGQWSIVLAALTALAWRTRAAGRSAGAGVLVGVAASLKVMPGSVVAFFVARDRRAAVAAFVAMVVMVMATLPLTGVSPWLTFVEQSGANVRALETWYANTASLHGLWARLFVGGAYAQPLMAAPLLGRALQSATIATLLAVALTVTVRYCRFRSPTGEADRALFALWATLAVLLNPLAWAHTVVLLALPIALLFSDGDSLALGGALVLLSIPKETLYSLAGAPPVAAGRAWLLSLHAVGALIVFGLAARRARGGRDD